MLTPGDDSEDTSKKDTSKKTVSLEESDESRTNSLSQVPLPNSETLPSLPTSVPSEDTAYLSERPLPDTRELPPPPLPPTPSEAVEPVLPETQKTPTAPVADTTASQPVPVASTNPAAPQPSSVTPMPTLSSVTPLKLPVTKATDKAPRPSRESLNLARTIFDGENVPTSVKKSSSKMKRPTFAGLPRSLSAAAQSVQELGPNRFKKSKPQGDMKKLSVFTIIPDSPRVDHRKPKLPSIPEGDESNAKVDETPALQSVPVASTNPAAPQPSSVKRTSPTLRSVTPLEMEKQAWEALENRFKSITKQDDINVKLENVSAEGIRQTILTQKDALKVENASHYDYNYPSVVRRALEKLINALEKDSKLSAQASSVAPDMSPPTISTPENDEYNSSGSESESEEEGDPDAEQNGSPFRADTEPAEETTLEANFNPDNVPSTPPDSFKAADVEPSSRAQGLSLPRIPEVDEEKLDSLGSDGEESGDESGPESSRSSTSTTSPVVVPTDIMPGDSDDESKGRSWIRRRLSASAQSVREWRINLLKKSKSADPVNLGNPRMAENSQEELKGSNIGNNIFYDPNPSLSMRFTKAHLKQNSEGPQQPDPAQGTQGFESRLQALRRSWQPLPSLPTRKTKSVQLFSFDSLKNSKKTTSLSEPLLTAASDTVVSDLALSQTVDLSFSDEWERYHGSAPGLFAKKGPATFKTVLEGSKKIIQERTPELTVEQAPEQKKTPEGTQAFSLKNKTDDVVATVTQRKHPDTKQKQLEVASASKEPSKDTCEAMLDTMWLDKRHDPNKGVSITGCDGDPDLALRFYVGCVLRGLEPVLTDETLKEIEGNGELNGIHTTLKEQASALKKARSDVKKAKATLRKVVSGTQAKADAKTDLDSAKKSVRDSKNVLVLQQEELVKKLLKAKEDKKPKLGM